MIAFDVVEQFEREVAEFAGAKYCVTVNSCTNAIFLSLMMDKPQSEMRYPGGLIRCPARTFISVPMAIKQAGYAVEFVDEEWRGAYYLRPSKVVDGALRFRRGMYNGDFLCVSFHARKHLNIGEGGAVLTDDPDAAEWLRLARYSGRKAPDFKIEDVKTMGWQMYMTPEKAARGLHLLSYLPPDLPDQEMDYADLRLCEVFK